MVRILRVVAEEELQHSDDCESRMESKSGTNSYKFLGLALVNIEGDRTDA